MGIRAIEEWQAPTKVSELRSFLGLVNYYRKFIVSYSKTTQKSPKEGRTDLSWHCADRKSVKELLRT